MVRGFLDLAARLARPTRELDVHPAQRTRTVTSRDEAAALVARGLATERRSNEEGPEAAEGGDDTTFEYSMRGLVQADVRAAIEDLVKEGGPELKVLATQNAASPSAHPGLPPAGLAARDAAARPLRVPPDLAERHA